MRKNISLAIAATTLGLAVAFPAFAGDAPVALIEGLTSPSQRVELMTYAHVGQVIHLNADQTMVLSYRDTCPGKLLRVAPSRSKRDRVRCARRYG